MSLRRENSSLSQGGRDNAISGGTLYLDDKYFGRERMILPELMMLKVSRNKTRPFLGKILLVNSIKSAISFIRLLYLRFLSSQ